MVCPRFGGGWGESRHDSLRRQQKTENKAIAKATNQELSDKGGAVKLALI